MSLILSLYTGSSRLELHTHTLIRSDIASPFSSYKETEGERWARSVRLLGTNTSYTSAEFEQERDDHSYTHLEAAKLEASLVTPLFLHAINKQY